MGTVSSALSPIATIMLLVRASSGKLGHVRQMRNAQGLATTADVEPNYVWRTNLI